MRPGLTRALRILLAAAVLAALAAWWLSRPQRLAATDLPPHDPDPRNGELLFHAGGCASCHGEDLAGGLELATAFGTFRVPNITPDREAGIYGFGVGLPANFRLQRYSPSEEAFQARGDDGVLTLCFNSVLPTDRPVPMIVFSGSP